MEQRSKRRRTASFETEGPRNQGVVSPSKYSKLANAGIPVPAQTGKHAATKRHRKRVLSEPITLPNFAAISGGVRNQALMSLTDEDPMQEEML